jgi:2-hydroxychromene-2-carboxylate isomerase
MIEFFFDISSPWTYLAFHNIQPLARELNVPVAWKPFLVGGVFNTVNPSVYASREKPVPAKAKYMRKDLQDWAWQSGLAIRFPPSVFPVSSVKALRACIALEAEGKLVDFATAAFEAYWGEDQDISQDAVLVSVAERSGVDWAILQAAIATQPIKDALKQNTDELIARGGFGSPTIFINRDDMYFGNDRLGLIRDAVLRHR